MNLGDKSSSHFRSNIYLMPWDPCDPLGDLGLNENTDDGDWGILGEGESPLGNMIALLPQGASNKLWSSFELGDSTSIMTRWFYRTVFNNQ